MSRVIKFRAWDYDTASGKYKMFCFEDIKNNCGAYFFDTHSYDFKHIIMGFTGLHDKNGKEIYEGDILECFDDTLNFSYKIKGVVKYNNDKAAYNIDPYAWATIEVIGNIHDNPELLEKKQ